MGQLLSAAGGNARISEDNMKKILNSVKSQNPHVPIEKMQEVITMNRERKKLTKKNWRLKKKNKATKTR
jgi:hypothetical protein